MQDKYSGVFSFTILEIPQGIPFPLYKVVMGPEAERLYNNWIEHVQLIAYKVVACCAISMYSSMNVMTPPLGIQLSHVLSSHPHRDVIT